MSKTFIRAIVLAATVAALAVPASAHAYKRSDRTKNAAILGAGIGLLSGNGIKGAIGGAVIGGGVGALTENGRKGRKAVKGAKKGAVLGAGLGLLSGNGIDGAIKGAVVGGAGGAILGRYN